MMLFFVAVVNFYKTLNNKQAWMSDDTKTDALDLPLISDCQQVTLIPE